MITFKIIHKNIINILPLILQIYLTFMGSFWVIIYLYFRFFVSRPTYTLDNLKTYIELRHYIGFVIFIMVHLILLCIVLYTLFFKEKKIYINPFFKYIMEKIQLFINYIFWKPLEKIHNIIAPKIPGSSRFFLFIEKKWTTNNVTPAFFKLLIIIFNIIPKVITAVIFFIDIVLLGSFKYFIYALPLLFIPIMLNIFLKIFESFAIRNIPNLQVYFSNIKYIGDTYDEQGNLIISDRGAYEFSLKPEYSHVDDLQETIQVLYQLNTIIEYVTFMKDQIQKYTPYITLITSSIYLGGGFYRLIYFLV